MLAGDVPEDLVLELEHCDALGRVGDLQHVVLARARREPEVLIALAGQPPRRGANGEQLERQPLRVRSGKLRCLLDRAFHLSRFSILARIIHERPTVGGGGGW